MVRYLIEGFVEKHHYKIDAVGFVSGQVGLTTYGLTNLPAGDAGAVRQTLRSLGINYSQQARTDDPDAMDLLFDLSEDQVDRLEEKLKT